MFNGSIHYMITYDTCGYNIYIIYIYTHLLYLYPEISICDKKFKILKQPLDWRWPFLIPALPAWPGEFLKHLAVLESVMRLLNMSSSCQMMLIN